MIILTAPVRPYLQLLSFNIRTLQRPGSSSIYHYTDFHVFLPSLLHAPSHAPTGTTQNRSVINVHGLSKTAHLWCCSQCLDNSQASINTKLHQVHPFSCWIFRASHLGGGGHSFLARLRPPSTSTVSLCHTGAIQISPRWFEFSWNSRRVWTDEWLLLNMNTFKGWD